MRNITRVLLIILITQLALCNISIEVPRQKAQEPIPITYLPYVIDKPGTYILTVSWYANASASPALIQIMSSDVTLYGGGSLGRVLRGNSTSICIYVHDKENVRIYDLPIIENWEYGISVINCKGVYISGSPLSDSHIKNSTVLVQNSEATSLIGLSLTMNSKIVLYKSNYTHLISLSLMSRSGIILHESFNNEVYNCTLDGKEIKYYEGESDLEISYTDFGQLIVVNCSNVVIRELELASSAIMLMEISDVVNCLIANVTISEGVEGIRIIEVNNCTITNCTIIGTDVGLKCCYSKNVTINYVTISNARIGIDLVFLKNFTITNSTLFNCSETAIHSNYPKDGYIYLNDFLYNARVLQVPDQAIQNVTWHSPNHIVYEYEGSIHIGYLGNYYSDYMGYDGDGDGVGEEPYEVYGDSLKVLDLYPLVRRRTYYRTPQEKATLSHIPGLFIIDGVFNATFIVGDSVKHTHTGFKAATADVVGAIRVAESFRGAARSSHVEAYVDTYVSRYVNGTVIIEWDKITTRALICVGGPGVNYLTFKYNGTYPFVWRYIPHVKSYIYSMISGKIYERNGTYDYAVIALVEERGRYVLIVWGLTRNGTQAACIALQNYDMFSDVLQGKAVIIRWTDSNGNGIPDKDDKIVSEEVWSSTYGG